MDFTLTSYKDLLESLKSAGYTFVTFRDYLASINLPDERKVNQSPDVPIVIGNRDNQSCLAGTQAINPEPGTFNPEPATFTYRNEMKVGLPTVTK